MKTEKIKLVMGILVFVIVVLAGVVAYTFAIRPALNGYVVQSQSEGYQYAILSIMQQAAQCKQVPLTYGNTTMNLVAVECLQQAQQAAQ
jgi:hypothetical protein